MNKETIQKLEDYFTNVTPYNIGAYIYDMGMILGAESKKVDYVYQSGFTHPDEMLYIGHFLNLPFCLDLGCPGAVHVLTGKRQGLVDEWDWYRNFELALLDAYEIEEIHVE